MSIVSSLIFLFLHSRCFDECFFISISNNAAYVPSLYDQYNRPIGLIPYDNATPTNGPCSTSPAMTTDAKTIDDDHPNDFNKQHSINSEDVMRTVV